MIFEYTLVFLAGLFVGIGVNDLDVEKKHNMKLKQQKMIIQKIKEDINNGYAPNVDLYKDIYNKYSK